MEILKYFIKPQRKFMIKMRMKSKTRMSSSTITWNKCNVTSLLWFKFFNSIDIIRTKERFKPSKDIMEESFAKYKSNLQKQVKRGNPECFGPELTDHVWITDCQSYKNLMSNFRCKKLLRTFISLTMFTL